MANYPPLIRLPLISSPPVSLALIGVRVASYPRLLRLPGGAALAMESAGLLVLYFFVVFRQTRGVPSRALHESTMIGLIAAAIEIANITSERFLTLSAGWNGAVTLTFMAATFVLWGATGFRAARSGERNATSIGLSVWSAIVTMTLAIAAGVALELFLAPVPPESMRTWAEFKRSGWTDTHAFAIANTLDSVVSHLLLGPVLGAFMGVIGTLLGNLTKASSNTKAMG